MKRILIKTWGISNLFKLAEDLVYNYGYKWEREEYKGTLHLDSHFNEYPNLILNEFQPKQLLRTTNNHSYDVIFDIYNEPIFKLVEILEEEKKEKIMIGEHVVQFDKDNERIQVGCKAFNKASVSNIRNLFYTGEFKLEGINIALPIKQSSPIKVEGYNVTLETVEKIYNRMNKK